MLKKTLTQTKQKQLRLNAFTDALLQLLGLAYWKFSPFNVYFALLLIFTFHTFLNALQNQQQQKEKHRSRIECLGMSSRRRTGRLRKGERTRLNNKYHKKSFLFLSEIFKPVFFLSSCNFHFIFANKHTFKLLLSARKQTIKSQASNTTNTFCFSLLA